LAASQTASIHQQIQETYNFQPHLLSDQEITRKSTVLDQFWTRAKADPKAYVPALRQELGTLDNPRFFYYDGSTLLLSLSDTQLDRKVALAAMARCDLRDVQPKDYFLQVHRMAVLNEDTTAAAFHVLERSNFKVFIPQHVLTLGQDYVFVYLLLPADQEYWLQRVVNRLQTERDPTAQKSLLLMLWYAQNDTADEAINRFAADPGKSSAPRTYAQKLLHRKEQIGSKQRAEGLGLTEGSLRQERRERLKVVSDEALIDLDEYTMALLAKRK
jgi:hypothetical protein